MSGYRFWEGSPTAASTPLHPDARGEEASKSDVPGRRGILIMGLSPTLHHVTKLETPSPDRHLTGPSWGHKAPESQEVLSG